ncbi:ImmA/IrrE family metallo-endopeptidase [Streptomyces sp. NPDC026673]|uniref:ImmA/IrrE family metallo-endopeptidase n=1 Tax=Streptomyces sp. NPDC026673 TaxID=3155724 RepID=UPI003405337E
MDPCVIERVRTVMDAAAMTKAAFARSVGLTPDKLSKSLSGVRRFTSLDLALIAEAGGTTVDWLLTGAEPLRPALAARTRGDTSADSAGAQEVTARFATAYEVLELLGRAAPLPEVPEPDPALDRYAAQGERLAAEARERLRVAEMATDELIAALEDRFGVDVAITGLPQGVDGLAWQADAFRLVLLAPTDLWTRQRFTLAHELCHILAKDARSVILESRVAPGRQKDLAEVRANVFASHLLMPARELTEAAAAAAAAEGATAEAATAQDGLSDAVFERLVVRFRVSPSALAARLHQLGLIDAARRRRLRVLTTEACHLLTGAGDDYQKQASRASAERFPPRVASELYKAYLAGETTLRPLAALLGTDVERLHGLLAPEPTPGNGFEQQDAEEGDPVFQP